MKTFMNVKKRTQYFYWLFLQGDMAIKIVLHDL